MTGADPAELTVDDLAPCFEGVVPAVVATASADGIPNVTYLSRVQRVDSERIALSNQFFSKTVRNLAENPRASLLLIDHTTYDQYRLRIAYERTERRGPVFEKLKADVDALAALEGMEDVFKLRAADIYRVLTIEQVPTARRHPDVDTDARGPVVAPDPAVIAEMAARLSRSTDLDAVVSTAVNGLAELLGYESAMLLLLDEEGRRLFTIASRGFEAEGVGSEVVVGEGLIGMTAARCTPLRIGNLRQMSKYSRTVRRSFEGGGLIPGRDIAVPGLPDVQSRLAVPALALGQLVGVVVVESREPAAYTAIDESVLTVLASLIAAAVEAERSRDRADESTAVAPDGGAPAPAGGPTTRVRFFEVDGSTFLDGDYLIKGVAGRLLWSLLGQHEREGRVDFTNREVRLDPTLDLPAFRDNFESRLILLKRRLDERGAAIRIEKTGRGRFRLLVEGRIELDPA
jgi:predicted pyridoxine 5'-phosphate oxidase superfamily flavin-nucleotide-binding protein